jgi:hypothetical protein
VLLKRVEVGSLAADREGHVKAVIPSSPARRTPLTSRRGREGVIPDLEQERADLAKAEQDISEGERRVSEQALRIEALRSAGHDTALAEELLATLKGTLAEWNVHRAEILRLIELLGGQFSLSLPTWPVTPSARPSTAVHLTLNAALPRW